MIGGPMLMPMLAQGKARGERWRVLPGRYLHGEQNNVLPVYVLGKEQDSEGNSFRKAQPKETMNETASRRLRVVSAPSSRIIWTDP